MTFLENNVGNHNQEHSTSNELQCKKGRNLNCDDHEGTENRLFSGCVENRISNKITISNTVKKKISVLNCLVTYVESISVFH